MILAIKSPYLNSVIPPETLVIFADNCSRLPEGKKNPTNGLIISLTRAVTNLEDAWPITNAIAKPIIPNVLRKSKNCIIRVLVGNGSFDDVPLNCVFYILIKIQWPISNILIYFSNFPAPKKFIIVILFNLLF